MYKWFALFCFLPAIAHARYYPAKGPFPMRTQHPVYLQMVQLTPAKAEVLPTGNFEVRVDSSYSNLYERVNAINLDMELWYLNWVATYGLLPNLEVGLELPLIHFGTGFLDSFIQNYHNAFGFPNGGRDQVQNGLFTYRITRRGNVVYQVPSAVAVGLSDISLFGKYQFLDETDVRPAFASRLVLKFPTGNSVDGLGSGNVGVGVGLAAQKSYKRLHGYVNLNYLADLGNDSLAGLMKKHAFDFALAGEVSISKKVAAIVQLSGGTARLKGLGLTEWESMPLDFVVGARGEMKNFFWQAAFSEDLRAIGPSVDFTVLMSVGMRFPLPGQLYQGDFWGSVKKEYLPRRFVPPQIL